MTSKATLSCGLFDGVIYCSLIINYFSMQYPYYDFSVSVFVKSLGALSHLLDKAAELALEKGSETAVLEAKIADDMFPFLRQIRITCDNAKGAAARLAGVSAPVIEDTETTIVELKVRVEKTLAFLATLTPEQFADAGARTIVLPYFPEKHMTGDGYLKAYALPNFFFHMTTAYDILRKEGAQIGKSDFMKVLPLMPN